MTYENIIETYDDVEISYDMNVKINDEDFTMTHDEDDEE